MATPSELIAGLSGYISYKEQIDLGPMTVTITKAQVEAVGQGEKSEDKPVLTFLETRKKMVLNKTRLSQLAEAIGAKTDPVGKKIIVDADTIDINGRAFDMAVILPYCEGE